MMVFKKRTLVRYYKKYMLVMGILGHFLFVFQAWKIFSTQSAEDLSIGGFAIAFVSLISWLIYGKIIKDQILMAVNAFGAAFCLLCLLGILLYA